MGNKDQSLPLMLLKVTGLWQGEVGSADDVEL